VFTVRPDPNSWTFLALVVGMAALAFALVIISAALRS